MLVLKHVLKNKYAASFQCPDVPLTIRFCHYVYTVGFINYISGFILQL